MRASSCPRGSRAPAVPVISTLGILVCGAMIYGLGWTNWARLIVWLLIGFVIYFGYSRRHSLLQRGATQTSITRPAPGLVGG